MNPAAAYPVPDLSSVSEPRRTAQWMAERMGFSEARAGQVALVVSELATNLAKHAREGEILLRVLEDPAEPRGIEVMAIDRGPGIPDLALSQQDGYSTSGTLGHGLGAIRRQSDAFWIYTQPAGTVIAARILQERSPAPHPLAPLAAAPPALDIGAVQVAKPREDVCGDAWSVRARTGRVALIIADGLGHGPHAHDAAHRAMETFAHCHEEAPERVVEEVHAALRGTRGAAVAVLALDLSRSIARYCGLGNIAALILRSDGARQSLVSHNGTAGHSAGRIHEFSYPVPPRSLIVMFSDGLGTHWSLDAYPGLAVQHPSLIAGVLYRDFSRRRDDITVVVARERHADRDVFS